MSLAELSEIPGKVASIFGDCDYISDPLDTFVHLCGDKNQENSAEKSSDSKPGGNHMLLESAEIESKNNLKSLIMVDAAYAEFGSEDLTETHMRLCQKIVLRTFQGRLSIP